jgi:hypothetical protein
MNPYPGICQARHNLQGTTYRKRAPTPDRGAIEAPPLRGAIEAPPLRGAPRDIDPPRGADAGEEECDDGAW